MISLSICLLVVLAFATPSLRTSRSSSKPQTAKLATAGQASNQNRALGEIWVVEQKGDTEFYSNGLRIENIFQTRTGPRQYAALRRSDGTFLRRTDPAGIVFHTTESQLVPFDVDHNQILKTNGTSLLAYVKRHALYHFVIDRFGRVHRIVAERDYANHAGHSVWADNDLVYLDLNHSFISVSFEAKTGAVSSPSIAAQVNAGRLLTDMLRRRYRIPEQNCVTHAQVSVNPHNMQIGYHRDWATSFPFSAMGIRNGYDDPNPAIVLFGFSYGQDLIQALGGSPWPGLVLSEEELVRKAAASSKTTENYRKLLQNKYRTAISAARKYKFAAERTHNET